MTPQAAHSPMDTAIANPTITIPTTANQTCTEKKEQEMYMQIWAQLKPVEDFFTFYLSVRWENRGSWKIVCVL